MYKEHLRNVKLSNGILSNILFAASWEQPKFQLTSNNIELIYSMVQGLKVYNNTIL